MTGIFVHHTIEAGANVSVFAQGPMLNRMHCRHHGFLQSIIPLVAVELNTECQPPFDCGLGIGLRVLALGAISWCRNLEEPLSCYVSTIQFIYLLFQRIHRSRLIRLWRNPTQAFWTDRQNFPWQIGCLQSRMHGEGPREGLITTLWKTLAAGDPQGHLV